jgi:hypothetical protein
MADVSRATKNFTPKQGQYLAYIHLYLRNPENSAMRTIAVSIFVFAILTATVIGTAVGLTIQPRPAPAATASCCRQKRWW